MKELLASIAKGLVDEPDKVTVEVDERQFDRVQALILSMTPQEREKPDIINPSRKRRIAAGAGMQVEDVNRLLSQHRQMQKMFKQFTGNKGKKMKRRMRNMPGMMNGMNGMGGPGGMNGFGL